MQVYRFGPLIVSLRYASDFDQNGLLYYIGSAGGTRAYVNPHVSGDVVVTWSSIFRVNIASDGSRSYSKNIFELPTFTMLFRKHFSCSISEEHVATVLNACYVEMLFFS